MDCFKSDPSIRQLVSLSEYNFTGLFIPYNDYFSLNCIRKKLRYSGKYSPYLLSNFRKTLCLTLACRDDPIKYNCCTLALCLAEYAKKYFRALTDSVRD